MKKRAAKVKRRQAKRKSSRAPLTEESAARLVQGLFRTRAARKRLRLLARSVYERVFDEATGAYFFHNVHTGDVSWEAPKLMGSEAFDEIADAHVSPHDAVTAYRSLAKDWQEVPAEGDASYYYNAATNETTWERPDILERLSAAVTLRDEMLGPDWREAQDPDDGSYFFHNTKTDETQWEPPKVDFRKTKEEKEREALAEKKRQMRLSKVQKQMSKRRISAAGGDSGTDDDDEDAEGNGSDGGADSDESSGPPEALAVGDDGQVASDQASFTSSDSESIYISSSASEGEDLASPARKPVSKRKRRKRERQRTHHFNVLAELASASDRERGEFEAKVRMKRFRKRKLAVLGISHLELESVPTEVTANARLARRLRSLVLSGNRIARLTPTIKALREQLRELHLDGNELVKVPVQTWYLTSLETLDLRNNRLREISREKGNMTVLREMNIWEIGIETMQSLRVLRLDGNLLAEVPDHVGTLASLEVLTLRANRLTGFAASAAAQLAHLVHLDLADNAITGLPDRFFVQMPRLQVLDVSGNSLEYLPPDISKIIESLRVLRCARNNLVQIPEALGRGAALEHLDARDNELETLPADWQTVKLRTVHLSNNQLAALPASLFAASRALQHINLRKNAIRPRLPAALATLEDLRVLDVGENALEVFDQMPPNVRVCLLDRNKLRALSGDVFFPAGGRLGRLDVSDNALRTLSPPNNNRENDSAPSGSQLRDVNLSGNELAALPGAVLGRLALRRLEVARNQLGSLAPELAHSRGSLEHLDMDRNRLRELPAFLGDMPALRFISLNHNLLTVRPDFLATNPRLQNWHASFNPMHEKEDAAAVRRALLNQAALLQSEAQPQRALEILDQVMADLDDDDDDDGSDHGGKASLLVLEVAQKRAMTQISLEHYAEAEADLSRTILLLDQPGAALLYYRGLARYKGLNDVKGALQDLDRSLALRPGYAPAQRVRAFCLLQMGHYQAALENASSALDFDMFDLDAQLAKAMALEKLVDLEGAIAAYQHLVSQVLAQGSHDNAQGEDDDKRKNQLIARISPWSPLGQTQYRWGLVLRDLERHPEAVIKFQDAADVLFVQFEKAQERSLRKRNLGNWLHMALMCRASTLQSMNRGKKARLAYEEALAFAAQLREADGEAREP